MSFNLVTSIKNQSRETMNSGLSKQFKTKTNYTSPLANWLFPTSFPRCEETIIELILRGLCP